MTIDEFVKKLKERHLLPRNIQTTSWESWTLVSCFDVQSSHFISESVAMGIDLSPEVSLWKCLTEYCERKLGKISQNPAAGINDRTDGLAAFPAPNGNDLISAQRARNNALAEAGERYLWSRWWEHHDVFFSIDNPPEIPDIELLKKRFNLKNIQSIQVPAQNGMSLLILLAETIDGGFVTGGAAGENLEFGDVPSRAFGELLRHLIAFERIKIRSVDDLSFYERRLFGFASGEWSHLVRNRISKIGALPIELPPLLIDEAIEHNEMNLISIHRCLYQGQLPFIGGELARLCI